MQTHVGLLRLMHYALVSSSMISCLFFSSRGLGLAQSTRNTDFNADPKPASPLKLTAPTVSPGLTRAHRASPARKADISTPFGSHRHVVYILLKCLLPSSDPWKVGGQDKHRSLDEQQRQSGFKVKKLPLILSMQVDKPQTCLLVGAA